jgi:hypothetical protein
LVIDGVSRDSPAPGDGLRLDISAAASRTRREPAMEDLSATVTEEYQQLASLATGPERL